MIRAPALYFFLPRWSARGGLLFESGRILLMNSCILLLPPLILPERYALYRKTLLLWNRRNIASIFAGVGVNPYRGVDVSADVSH